MSGKMRSVLQTEKECIYCGTTLNLQEHHIFRSPYRDKSEQYGLKVWLCAEHHIGANGVHGGNEWLDRQLKIMAQQHFEDYYSRERFIKEFGVSYL